MEKESEQELEGQTQEQILIRLDRRLLKKIDEHWQKYKPRYANRTHFFLAAAEKLMERDNYG